MVKDDEIDKLIDENLEKDINQSSSIDKDLIEQQMSEMGWLSEIVHRKIEKDKTCFECKRKVDFSKEKLHLLEVTKTDPGMVAIVSVCQQCYSILTKKQDIEVKKNDGKF